MADFFIYSVCGDSLFLAMRLMREGHRVRMYIEDVKCRTIGERLVLKVATAAPRREEIVIFDYVGAGRYADTLKKRGFKVIGGSEFCDRIEFDRKLGMGLMTQVGIKTPETHEFTTFDDGGKFLATAEGEWFYKPDGNIGYTVNGDAETLTRHFEWMKRRKGMVPSRFILQRKVNGTEISTEGWFDGERFVYPFNGTIEDKKFLTGNKGQSVGCSSNLVWCYEEPCPRLAKETVEKMAEILRAARYAGPIDFNAIVEERSGRPLGLEWTPRFGYDALIAYAMLIDGDLGQQLFDFAWGKLDAFNARVDAYAMTINVSVPPYPQDKYAKDAEGMLLDPEIVKDPIRIALRDVRMNEKMQPEVAGGYAIVATLGEVGWSIWELRDRLLDRAGKLRISDLQYRIDPVERASIAIESLALEGYERPSIKVPAPSMDTIMNEMHGPAEMTEEA